MLEQKLDKISQENQNQVVNIKISDVYPNGDQPRIYFDEDKIIALCESIKKHGVLQPIVVRPDDEGRYMIIAGERRYRASIMANKESIPAIIKDMPIKEVLQIALVENLQRENLNIIEEEKAFKNLIDKHKTTQEELAELVGRSRPYITNTMRLLNLSDEVKKYIELEKISPGHGKALLRVSNKEKQIGLAQQIIKENLSVRKTEEIIKGMLEEKKIKNKSKEKDIFINNNIKNIIKLITKSENEDLEQEVYIKLWKNSEKYQERGSFKSWVGTIAKNTSKDYLKSAVVRYEQDSTSDDFVLASIKDKKTTPEANVIASERQQRIIKAIDSLKPKLRETIMLCEIYGYTYEEAASRLKCPIGTVKSRIYNAKKELAEVLKDLL